MTPAAWATDGDVEIEVLPEIGARLHRVRAFGHELLRTPDDPDAHRTDGFFWGAYVMAPWCNRVETGPVQVGARRIDLPSNFFDGSAIHGQVYDRAWVDLGDGRFAVRGGEDGWPWPYEVQARYTVAEASVRVDLALTNLGTDPMPAGIGIHPWFRRPALVAIHGDAVYPANVATEPQPEPVAGAFDLREVGPMADGLDATWTGLTEPAVEVRWPDAGVGMTMHTTSPSTHIVAASPADLGAVAIEPETHAPQGIRRLLRGEPGGLAMLEPRAALQLTTTLAFARYRAE
jgi:aldose 1-epimerase